LYEAGPSYEDGIGPPITSLKRSFIGTYDVSTTGRSTATLSFTGGSVGFSKFIFYVVSTSELLFMEADPNPCSPSLPPGACSFKGGISGLALQQSGGAFTKTSLNGATVFNLSAAVGQATFDGIGGLTGIEDENDDGGADVPFSGNYTVDDDGLGRGVITLADQQTQSFYLVSPGKAFVVDSCAAIWLPEIDSCPFRIGMFEPQSGEPFGNASISGNYVLETSGGLNNYAFGPDFSPVSGVLTADGNGSLGGVSDNPGGSGIPFVGSYSVDSNGRATLAITPSVGRPSNMVFYLVSPSKAVGIQVDPGATNPAVGIIEK
jgi:hypothetical protein